MEPSKYSVGGWVRRGFRVLAGRPSAVALISVLSLAIVATAGSLTPPGSPSSTMHTLAEIYDTIAGTFSSTSITANQNGSLVQHLKYIEANLAVASNSSGFFFTPTTRNVGIGTTSVDAKFEVAGTASISGTTTLRGVTYTWPSATGGSGNVLTSSAGILTWASASATTIASLSQNFGPATDNTFNLGSAALRWKSLFLGPGSLHVTSTTGTAGSGTNYTDAILQFTAGSSLSLGSQAVGTGSAGSLELRTGNTARLFVSSGGNVGIGTTNLGTNALELVGGASISSTLRIGPVAAASETLEVSGTASISGNVTVQGSITSNGGFSTSERFGNGSTITGTFASAFGNTASAGPFAIAFGYSSFARTSGVALGRGAIASGSTSIAIGEVAEADGARSILIGTGPATVGAAGTDSIGIGTLVSINSSNAVAIGRQAGAGGEGSAFGFTASATGSSTALGARAVVSSGAGPAIAIGRGSTASVSGSFVAGSTLGNVNNVYFGNGIRNAVPFAYTINGTGALGTNIAGANLTLAGGRGVGNQPGGSLLFQTAASGSSGSTLNALTTRLTIDARGLATFANNVSVSSAFEVGNSVLWAKAGGNVGIGTSNPETTLEVTGGNASISNAFFAQNSTGNVGIGLFRASVGGVTRDFPPAPLTVIGSTSSPGTSNRDIAQFYSAPNNSMPVFRFAGVETGPTVRAGARMTVFGDNGGNSGTLQLDVFTASSGNQALWQALNGITFKQTAQATGWSSHAFRFQAAQLSGGLGGPDANSVFDVVNENSTPLFSVRYSGNVGIGNVTPAAKLDIIGSAGNYDLLNIASSTGTSILHVTKGGNVGIGTTSPIAKLQVTAGSNPALVVTSGNIGIGTTAVDAKLEIQANSFTTATVASLSATSLTTGTVLTMTVPASVSAPAADYLVVRDTAGQVYASLGAGGELTLRRNIFSHGATSNCTGANTPTQGCIDYAESFPTSDRTLSAGDIVAADPHNPSHVIKATASDGVLGIVSTNPAALIDGGAFKSGTAAVSSPGTVPVALAGRVPVKVSGSVKAGDRLAASDTPGIAAKAVKAGMTVGIALEDSSGPTVLAFVNTSYWAPASALTTAADLPDVGNWLHWDFQNLFASIVDAFQLLLHIGFSDGTITTKKLCLDDVCVTKDQLQQLLHQQGVPSPTPGASPSVTPSPQAIDSPSPSPTESAAPSPTQPPLAEPSPSVSDSPTP